MATVDLVVPSTPQSCGVVFTVTVSVQGAAPGAQIDLTVKQTRPRGGFFDTDQGTADALGFCSFAVSVTLNDTGWVNLAAIAEGNNFVDVDAEAVKVV